jgi:two-component system phosphate regulon sensor histidine kinase PhoR
MTVFLGVLIGAILVALIVGWYMWRNVRRDLRAVSDRLQDRDAAGAGETRMTSMLEQLDRMAEDARVSTLAAESDRDRLILAVQAVTDGVVLVDEAGNVMLRNDAAVQFSGARHADALAEEAISVLLDRARMGETGERELQLFGPPRRVLRVRAVPLTSSGRLVGAVALVRDVSEARRVESVRRDFVANVSHELKTPIGASAPPGPR